MQQINKEKLIAEIVRPTSDEFHRRMEACIGWYVYVVLPVLVVSCGFIWITLPSIALFACIMIGIIWGVLYVIARKTISEQSKEEAYDCFNSMFPVEHPDYLNAVGAFISISGEEEFIVQVQEQLIEESGKTAKELKNLFMQREYNSARNILDGPIIPVIIPEANNNAQSHPVQQQNKPLHSPHRKDEPPPKDKTIKLDLGE